MQKENVRKLGKLLETLDTVVLTTVDDKYHLVSRPMSVRVDDFDGVLRLFAPKDSRCVAHIGLATQVTNHDRIARYWHNGLNRWFPSGPTTAALIEITVFEGRSWTVAVPAERLPEHVG